MVNAIVVAFLVTLATVSAMPNADIEQDIAQDKFFFNFPWIALPNLPTRPPPVVARPTAAPTAVAPTKCTDTKSGAVATKVAAACTCGTPVKNCARNDVCTLGTTGAGTCSTTLGACPTTAAPTTPAACECKGATTFVCIAPKNGCTGTAATTCT